MKMNTLNTWKETIPKKENIDLQTDDIAIEFKSGGKIEIPG